MYTMYAASWIGKQEVLAREGDIKLVRQGHGTFLITETFKDHNPGNRRNGRAGPITRVDRHTVNTKEKTCTCAAWKTNRMPCKHVILSCDFQGLRDTTQGQYQFRKDWVPRYFWRENYTRAYQGLAVHAPDMNNDTCFDPPAGMSVYTSRLHHSSTSSVYISLLHISSTHFVYYT